MLADWKQHFVRLVRLVDQHKNRTHVAIAALTAIFVAAEWPANVFDDAKLEAFGSEVFRVHILPNRVRWTKFAVEVIMPNFYKTRNSKSVAPFSSLLAER